jgi:hypothetical protein
MISSEKKSGPKESYQRPVLTVYGTIRDLTQGNNTMGMNDHVSSPLKTG